MAKDQNDPLPLKPSPSSTFVSNELSVNLPEVPKGKTTELAAEKAGFGSKNTYRQAKIVVEKAAPEKSDRQLAKAIGVSQQHGVEFSTVDLELPDRQAAINWIINNQLGRRNLHPDQASYLRGKRYNGEKLTHGTNQHTVDSTYQNDKSKQTHERLAEEYKVSPATITRDGQYAAAVDSLASVGVDPQSVIAHASKADVHCNANGLDFLPARCWRR